MQEQTSYQLIDRQVGLLGGTVLLVGSVIGISVFILPGELIGLAGPSIVLALAISIVPMILSVLGLLQLGGALPVAGGLYVYGSRLVGPFWGFAAIWLVVPAIWSTLLFTSTGFAEFTRFFIDVPVELLMAGVLVAFMALNLFGITLVAAVQLIMVAVIIGGALAFIVPGAGAVDLGHYSPLFPEGIGSALIAVVALYIPFQGFGMIIELGEELEDPVRNIPRVLLIGMTLAVVLSIGLVAVFVGLDRWETLAELGPGGLAEAAGRYLPTAVGAVVAVAAVLAALTTLNATITSYSRTLMRASRDAILSPGLAEIHPRTQAPYRSILVLCLPPLLLVPISPPVVTLAVFLALIILLGNLVGAIALWNLPRRYPEHYRRSVYRLPLGVLRVVAIGGGISAVLFWLAVLATAAPIAVAILVLLAIGYGYYRLRLAALARRGIDLRLRLQRLHAHEVERAAGGRTPTGG